MCDPSAMYITNVEKDGVFLKIWGQIDKKAALDVELALYKAYPMYEEGKHVLSPANLQIGVLCCAKYIDEKYYRARITNDDTRCAGTIEVNFIDYGNRDIVPIANLRSIECFNALFINLPPLAMPFILSEVVSIGGEWNDIILEQISRQVRYMEVNYVVASTHLGYKIIKIFLVNKDLASHLVRNNLMQSISLENQEALLSEMIPRSLQVVPPADQSLLQYKSVTLEPHSQHEVYVSYITDGPCHFSVQLKKSEAILAQLMREINSIPLKTFDELPIPGTVCLAKCIEDSHICRAVITSEVDNQYKLFYVDFGNTEIVPPDNIYQMPFKYIIPKIMAIRLSLKGVDKSTVTLEMQCAFKQFVDNRLLMMEVYPSAKKMCLPKCRMWCPETNVDVMEVLNKAAQLAYPSPIALHRGFTRPVKVAFVYSCNRFYVHLKSNEEELGGLMANMQVYCNSVTASFLEQPKVGQPCCAQFTHDGQWYRSLIAELNGDLAKVKYIDYGNEEEVPASSLKTIEGELLTCMRPQAVECCLNGYQNMPDDPDRDNKLEELILDREFTMKVIDIVGARSLVDLWDQEGRSVTDLLMEVMVNQTKVQVVTNEVESGRYGSSERRNGRSPEGEGWSPRDKSQGRRERNEDWRKGSQKGNGLASNESGESWRHKNNKNDSEWQDNTSNENFRRGRKTSDSRKSPSTKGQNNNWNPQEQNDNFQNQQSFQEKDYSQNNQNEWNGKEANRGRNKSFRQENESYGNKENGFNRNKSRNYNDNYNSDNSTKGYGENEGYQGVKRKTRNFDRNDSHNRSRSRTNNEEWGNKKSGYNGDDYNEKKSYREKNSYDSDNSYGKGKNERSYDSKPKYNDRGDNRKKPYRKDNEFRSNDYEKTDGRKFSPKNEPKWNDRKTASAPYQNTYAPPKTIDAAAVDAPYLTIEASGRHRVTLSWFHNPCSFFCQLADSQPEFADMMERIQEDYKDLPPGSCLAGAPAIALFPEDNVLYRSRVLKNVGGKVKVYYVDFGNISVVDKVWPIDKKYMELPMQAIPCGLGGVRPTGEDWPDPEAFAGYMQKESLECEFRRYEVDRYMVNLYSDAGDIKQQLVQDNLALYVEPPATLPDFDLNFFSGHTFRAMVDRVESLEDFYLSLQSGVQLACRAHNLAQATERYEEELKGKEGQVLVVYCDNIVEDRLEVTLYDHSGTKIIILNPDEGAFDTIEPVCPHLLTQPRVEGFVSHVSDACVVLQPSECAGRLETLLNEIYEHYEALPQDAPPIIPEEGFLYAVRGADGNWYRGRVASFDDDKVTVTYVDYGNREDVGFEALRELDPRFYWYDRMAIEVHVNVPTADLLEKQIVAQVRYGELGIEGEILEILPDYVPQQVTQPETATLDQQFDAGLRLDEPEAQPPAPVLEAPLPEQTQQIAPVPSEGTAVVISHIDGPSDFYIQLAEAQDAIAELQSRLQERIAEMPDLESTTVGGLCAAPYSVDQMWYRSQILDADEDITTVRFIDYGNTDVIDNNATKLKTLPAEFLSLEEYATRCRLPVKPLESDWSKQCSDRFEQLAYADSVTVLFVSQDEKANRVELFSDGRNVREVLVAENLAAPCDDLSEDLKQKGYISHMNSPSEFWVQLDGWCAELEWIAEQLSNAASFPELEDLTPGSLCAAMFPDDEMWYRARILSNTVAGIEVLFVDYGNSCVCGNLKQLPEHLVMAPPLALKCSLQKPEGLISWTPEAAQKFIELSADGQTEFEVRKLTTGETSTVELYANGEEVSAKLLPPLDHVKVVDIQSAESFAVTKDGAVSDQRYRLEKVPGVEYDGESTRRFVEINDEGKTVYGMEYLSENTVRLYIDGNDIRKEILPILKNKSLSSLEGSAEEPQSKPNSSEKSLEQTETHEICDNQREANSVCEIDTPVEQSLQVPDQKTPEICQNPTKNVCESQKTQEIYETSQNENSQAPAEESEKVRETEPAEEKLEVSQEEILDISDKTPEELHTVEIDEISQVSESEPAEEKLEVPRKECQNAPEEVPTHCAKEIDEVSVLTTEPADGTPEVTLEKTHEICDNAPEEVPTVCEETGRVSQDQASPVSETEKPEEKLEETREICDNEPAEEKLEAPKEETHGICDIVPEEVSETKPADVNLEVPLEGKCEISENSPDKARTISEKEVCDIVQSEERQEVSEKESQEVASSICETLVTDAVNGSSLK